MKKALDKIKNVTTRETPNKGIVAGKIGPSGRYSVTQGTFRASSSGEKVSLACESKLEQKSYTTSKETKTQLGAAGTDNSPVENARVTKKRTAFGVTRRYNTGALNTQQVTRLTSQEKQRSHGGVPIKQLGSSIKGETPKIGNNLSTGEKKEVLQEKVEQKIPDDEEAVPQKGRIRSIEGNLPAAASSSSLSRHGTLENLSTIGKQGEESKKQGVATLSEGTEAIRKKVVDSLSQTLMTEFPQSTQEQNLQEEPDSHGDSDSGVDLPGSNSEQNSESPINSRSASVSSNHVVEEIIESFNPLIEECDSELSRLNKARSGILQTTQELRTRSVSFSSSTESLNSILSAAEEDDTMQSDGEDKLNEERSPILQAKQEPQVQEDPIQFEQIGPIRTEQEPINEITPAKKQSSNRNSNITLAICYLAAFCFIAAAFKESVMLFLIGTAFLITAVVIEWQKPSRELTSISSNPHVGNKAIVNT